MICWILNDAFKSSDVYCQWESIDTASLSESVEKWCSSCFYEVR